MTAAVPAPRSEPDGTALDIAGPDVAGLDSTGLAAFSLAGDGLDTTGLAAIGVAGDGLAGDGPDATGLAAYGLAGDPLADVGLDATGLAAFGLAGHGLASDGPAGTGPDDTDTATFAALTGTLPPSFGSEVARLAGLAVTDGEPAPIAGVADNGAAVNGSPGDPASALRSPGHRLPSHSRRLIRQTPGAAAGRPAGRQPGIARGVLVTPWFAAAAGFVIAASLWIYAPRPQLAFPITISKPQCTPDGCTPNVDLQGAGSLPINSGQPTAHPHNSAEPAGTGTRAPTRTAASGLSFGYVVQPLGDGHFALTVSVTGKHPIKDWHLDFVLPGDHIEGVFGADWKAEGSHRVVVSPFTTGDQGQHGGGGWDGGRGYGNQGDHRAGQADQGGGDNHGGPPDPYSVTFTVVASGTSTAPIDCYFDGTSCTFQKLSSFSPGRDGHFGG